VTVNLAPADVRKAGTGFDLAIAIATLAATGECAADRLDAGSSSASSRSRAACAACGACSRRCVAARDRGLRGVIVATENAPEAAVVEGIEVRDADSLREVCEFLAGRGELRTGADARAPSTGPEEWAGSTCATSAARSTPSAPSRSPPRGATT
jgi:magnesium chelatase family protein